MLEMHVGRERAHVDSQPFECSLGQDDVTSRKAAVRDANNLQAAEVSRAPSTHR
jgi:hypothetical protein